MIGIDLLYHLRGPQISDGMATSLRPCITPLISRAVGAAGDLRCSEYPVRTAGLPPVSGL